MAQSGDTRAQSVLAVQAVGVMLAIVGDHTSSVDRIALAMEPVDADAPRTGRISGAEGVTGFFVTTCGAFASSISATEGEAAEAFRRSTLASTISAARALRRRVAKINSVMYEGCALSALDPW